MSLAVRKTSEQIQRDVLEEMKWDTRVRETAVGVEVDTGVVTLTGTVDSWTARMAAQDAAHRVAGVLDVANDINVKLPGSLERNDTDIARAVRTALEWDVMVPHDRVHTTVSNGVLTLEGKLAYWSEYEDAARCVRNLSGVREVRNLLQVVPSAPAVTPQAVRTAIEHALERHVEHAASHVTVAVIDDKVILSGDVPSWAERRAIEGAVRGTHGVAAVENHLLIPT